MHEDHAEQPSRSQRRAAESAGRSRGGARSAPRAGRRKAAASAPIPNNPAGAPTGPSAIRKPANVRRTGPVRVFATLLVVPAIFGTVAVPAYAFMPGGDAFQPGGAFSFAVAEAQDLDVSAVASGAPISSDAYAVTTKQQIDEAALSAEEAAQAAWAAELASRGSGSYAIYTVKAEGDDYPWWDQVPDDYGGGLSPLRYYYRECVDFVAWRLNRDAGVTSAPWKWDWSNLAAGSAYAWADEWAAHGWPTSSEPVVGAVAWFPYNHVAYVQSINDDGTVNIEEYNQNSDHSYHRRTIAKASALYLYPPG
ncbi:CHAP domain-containing protein [Agromyces sp. PvR057]|uniref:CHAP domain-containing protein n=1 Tax=Agromyces sp. PvR057 TaxID=3156403 RepID=UPI000E2785BB